MPNPKFTILPTSDPSASTGWQPHNGWLARVGGDIVSGGSHGFPAPGAGVASPRTVDVDVPGLGLVRIRYETSQYSHYRSSYWRWGAVWVDKIDDQGNVVEPNGPVNTQTERI